MLNGTILERPFEQVKSFFLPCRFIIIVAVLGLLIRLLVAPFSSWTYDVYPYYSATVGSLSGQGIYGQAMYSYPPLYQIVTYPLMYLLSLFADPSTFGTFQPSMVNVGHTTKMLVPFVTSPAFNIMIKLPLIVADLLVGYFIYHIVKHYGDEIWAKRAFILWVLNPLVIVIGSMMGQFDVLAALMTVAALYFAIKQKYFLVGLLLGLGTLFKVYPIFIFVFYFVLILAINYQKKSPWLSKQGRVHIFSLVIGGAVSLVTVLPFFVNSESFLDVIFRRTDYQQFGGASVWSLWNAFSNGQSPDVALPWLHIGTLIYLTIVGVAVVYAIWVARRIGRPGGVAAKEIVIGNMLLIGTMLVVQPLTNPQHLLWLLPFLLLYPAWGKAMEIKFISLSIIGVLFLFSLQSFYALFYPLAVYTGLADISTLNNNISLFFTSNSLVNHDTILGIVIFAALMVLLTTLLPARYDPIQWVQGRTRKEVGK